MPLAAHAIEALAREACGARFRIAFDDALERSARLLPAPELVLAEAHLEKRVAYLARTRVAVDDALELRQRLGEVALHVERLGDPVL